MNGSQEYIKTMTDTVAELKEIINAASELNGDDPVIHKCTKFTDYPDILRSVISSMHGGMISVFAYRVSDINPGVPIDDGNYDFETNTFHAPTDGSKANDLKATDTDTIWMTQAVFTKVSRSKSIITEKGSNPIKISSFVSSAPIIQEQSVYYSSNSELGPDTYPNGGNGDIALNDQSLLDGGTENYPGLNSDYPYVWISNRKKTNGVGSKYSNSVLYSYLPKNGKDGETGIRTRTVFAFTSTETRDNPPNTPYGGTGDILSNDIIFPDGGSESIIKSDIKKYSGLSTATFSSDVLTNPIGSTPSCITGDDGIDGTDGTSTEFIYASLENTEDLDVFNSYFNSNGFALEVSNTDTIPNFILNGNFRGTSLLVPRVDRTEFVVQLTDSPIGIDGVNSKAEIYWTRNKTSNGWSNWVGPMYGSVGGENGMDGDGIEYIFTASDNASCDTPLPLYKELIESNPGEAEKFQKNGYIPIGGFDNDDDGGGLGPDTPYLFSSSRKQYTADDGTKMGGEFSTPSIWGHYGKDGYGSYTSFAFCISKDDLSNYKVTGGRYDDAFRDLYTVDSSGKVSEIEGYDTIPREPKFDETIGMINKLFKGLSDESSIAGFGPMKMSDSEHFQVEYNCPISTDLQSQYDGRELISLEDFKNIKLTETPPVSYDTNEELELAWREYVYNNGFGLGNDGKSGAEYMATARFVNNKWEAGSVNKIKGESGDASQFIFRLTNGAIPDNPTPADQTGDFQTDNYLPDNGSFNPPSVEENLPVCGMAKRDRKNGTGEKYSNPSKGSMFAKGNVHLELSEDEINIPVEKNGYIDADYNDFIVVKLFVYDNGNLVDNSIYSAIINNDVDVEITSVNDVPQNPTTSGFFGNMLYLGRDYLNRYYSSDTLEVECRAEYNNVPYVKKLKIKKSTNVYELILSQNVLHLDNNKKFKDNYLDVQVTKWVQDRFETQASGYLEGIMTYADGTTETKGSNLDIDTIESISLVGYQNVKSIQINYKLDSQSEILTSEQVGTVSDGLDGENSISKFKSQVFCRTNADISTLTPSGGTFDNPIPSSNNIPDVYDVNDSTTLTTGGTDGIPAIDSLKPKKVGMSSRGFSSDGKHDESGTAPVIVQETSDTEIGWCDVETDSMNEVGDPDNDPLNAGYDGDELKSAELTRNPIWMAICTKINGKNGPGTVSKIKGEKGDPGPKGDSGPMARYSVGNNNAPEYYYSRNDNQDGYDIVEYNNIYYLCDRTHISTSSPNPETDQSGTGIKSDHFAFLTAENAAIKTMVAKAVQAENVVAKKLETTGDEARIRIENGTIEIFGSKDDKTADIRFGVDENGVAILIFYDKDGIPVYDLGSTYGFRNLTKETIHEGHDYARYYKIGGIMDPEGYDRAKDLADAIIEELKQDVNVDGSQIRSYIYSCKTTTSDGQVETCDEHGVISDNKSTLSLLNGIYLGNHHETSYYDLSDDDFEELRLGGEENGDLGLKSGDNFSPLKLHYCNVVRYVDGRPAGITTSNGSELNDMYGLAN